MLIGGGISEQIYMKTRRMFLKDGALLAAGTVLASCAKPKEGAFTREERLCLIALAEQIVPSDDYEGASGAGVINYIETFTEEYYPEILPIYKNGLSAVQKATQRLYGQSFQELDTQTQTAFMLKMELGELDNADWQNTNQRAFFNEILERTMQGFYGPARHGGNKNNVAYRMLKFNMPIVTGQNRYDGGVQNG